MNNFCVYVHRRPSNGSVFYVGKGRPARPNSHWGRNQHWHSIVAGEGGREVQVLVRNLDNELALLIEMELIDQYRRLGVKLANLTDGGVGTCGYTVSAETKAKISEKSRNMSEEARAKMRAAWQQRRLRGESQETREKKRIAMLGRVISEAARAKMAATKRGKKLSQESLQKRRERMSEKRASS